MTCFAPVDPKPLGFVSAAYLVGFVVVVVVVAIVIVVGFGSSSMVMCSHLECCLCRLNCLSMKT